MSQIFRLSELACPCAVCQLACCMSGPVSISKYCNLLNPAFRSLVRAYFITESPVRFYIRRDSVFAGSVGRPVILPISIWLPPSLRVGSGPSNAVVVTRCSAHRIGIAMVRLKIRKLCWERWVDAEGKTTGPASRCTHSCGPSQSTPEPSHELCHGFLEELDFHRLCKTMPKTSVLRDVQGRGG